MAGCRWQVVGGSAGLNHEVACPGEPSLRPLSLLQCTWGGEGLLSVAGAAQSCM